MTEDAPSGAGWPWPADPAALWQAWVRWLGGAAPLSGDVSQAIESSFVRSVGGQFGFVNVNAGGAGDPALELRITEQVASYGRQLGRLLDAVDVLVRRDGGGELSPADQKAVDAVQKLRAEVEEVKRRAVTERVDRLVADVRTLAGDPHGNRAALDRLWDALGPPPP